MGIAKKNHYTSSHWQVTNGVREYQGFGFRLHQANLTLDVVLSECSATQATALLSSVGSLTDFTQVAAGIWGADWSTLDEEDRDQFRLFVGLL